MIKLRIKTGDTVKVIAGASKGKEGKVTKVIKDNRKIVVEGVNVVSKHIKPSAQNTQGKIEKVEAPIHISNVSLLDPKSGEPTRVGYKIDDHGRKVRYSKKSGEII